MLDAGCWPRKARTRRGSPLRWNTSTPIGMHCRLGLVFGTLDSRRWDDGLGTWVGIMLLQALVRRPQLAVRKLAGHCLPFNHGVLRWGLGWLLSVMGVLRERFRGQLAHRAHCYAARGLEIAGFQIMLMVAGVSQGVGGAEAYARCHASATFGTSLIVAWAFSIGVFDVSCVDPRAAVALRLKPLELSCLICAGGVVLSGLAGFVIAEQNKPNLQAAEAAEAPMVSAAGRASRRSL